MTPELFSSLVTSQENGVSALHIHHVELRMTVTAVCMYVQLCIKRFHVLFMSLCNVCN